MPPIVPVLVFEILLFLFFVGVVIFARHFYAVWTFCHSCGKPKRSCKVSYCSFWGIYIISIIVP